MAGRRGGACHGVRHQVAVNLSPTYAQPTLQLTLYLYLYPYLSFHHRSSSVDHCSDALYAYGHIVGIRMARKGGCAFVEFSQRSEAEAALQQVSIGGRMLAAVTHL